MEISITYDDGRTFTMLLANQHYVKTIGNFDRPLGDEPQDRFTYKERLG